MCKLVIFDLSLAAAAGSLPLLRTAGQRKGEKNQDSDVILALKLRVACKTKVRAAPPPPLRKCEQMRILTSSTVIRSKTIHKEALLGSLDSAGSFRSILRSSKRKSSQHRINHLCIPQWFNSNEVSAVCSVHHTVPRGYTTVVGTTSERKVSAPDQPHPCG